MTMRKVILTVLTAASILLCCGAVSAQMHRAHGGPGAGMPMADCFRDMDLTPARGPGCQWLTASGIWT